MRVCEDIERKIELYQRHPLSKLFFSIIRVYISEKGEIWMYFYSKRYLFTINHDTGEIKIEEKLLLKR